MKDCFGCGKLVGFISKMDGQIIICKRFKLLDEHAPLPEVECEKCWTERKGVPK